MRTPLLVALLAATALIPAAASAQRMGRAESDDRQARVEARAERRAERAQQPRAEQPRPEQPRFEQPRAEQPRVEQPRVEQPRAEPSRDRGNRSDGGSGWNRGARPDDGGDRRQRDFVQNRQPQVQQQLTPLQQPQAQSGNDRNRDGRPDGRGGSGQWRGDRGGNGQQVTIDRRTDTVRNDGIRNDGGRNDWRNTGTVSNDRRGNDWRGNGGRNDNRFADRGRNDRGTWNRDWRRDGRYDWNSRRQYNRNAFHLPRYYAPRGWNYGYRRLNIGFTLTAALFGNNYWIEDPYYYGLPEAYGPYRWVRYYNDALLVDVYSGQVVDTVYDIFW
jgi:hypothetical protein